MITKIEFEFKVIKMRFLEAGKPLNFKISFLNDLYNGVKYNICNRIELNEVIRLIFKENVEKTNKILPKIVGHNNVRLLI